MMPRKFPVVLVVLVVIVLLIVGGNALRQAAWNEGYMMGRLSAGTDGGAAVPLPYGYPGYSSFPGWGTVLLVLFLAFVALSVLRHMRQRAWRAAGGPPQGAGQAHAEHGAGEYGAWWHHGVPPWCWMGERPAEGPAEPGKEEQKEPEA